MSVRVITGDCRACLAELEPKSIHCIVTSPPFYGLRDYGVAGQIGLEPSPEDYIAELVAVFRAARRALRDDATVWLNLGDSYANDTKWGGSSSGKHVSALYGASGIGRGKKSTGLKSKDLMMIPARVALALQADGWWLRSDIIWHKPNPMPESVTDRPTSAHEHVFLLAKSERYYFDAEAVKEPGTDPDRLRNDRIGGANGHLVRHSEGGMIGASATRNIRNVWTIATEPYSEAHFATFPPSLIEPCIKAGCPVGGTVLDPFGGAGTTGLVADRLKRNAILIELNPAYAEMARNRIREDAGMFGEVA
jgi:DNA modification methylase